MESGDLSARGEGGRRVRAAGDAGRQRLLADEAIAAGEYILTLNGQMVAEPTQYSVQVAMNVHVHPPWYGGGDAQRDPQIWRNLNHSCDASARLLGTRLVALRAMSVGDEITFNYNTTEFEMSAAFMCGCGACGGARIAGFGLLNAEERRSLWPIVGEHVRALAIQKGLGVE